MDATSPREPAQLHLAIVTFDRGSGAEQAFATVRESSEGAPWLRELALVHRGRKKLTVHGTFAGHYLDTEQEGDFIGRDTAIGALTGAILGAAFGPPGFAAGMVAGGSLGGAREATHHAPPVGELYEQLRVHVPHGSSAVVLLSAPEHTTSMLAAFGECGGHAYDRALTAEQVVTLEAAVAQAPPAAEPPTEEDLTVQEFPRV
jgi:uncharacterized membrane protein